MRSYLPIYNLLAHKKIDSMTFYLLTYFSFLSFLYFCSFGFYFFFLNLLFYFVSVYGLEMDYFSSM